MSKIVTKQTLKDLFIEFCNHDKSYERIERNKYDKFVRTARFYLKYSN